MKEWYCSCEKCAYNHTNDNKCEVCVSFSNFLRRKDDTAIKKVRPSAEKRYSCGNDGRDARWVIEYSCPNCGKSINKGDIACDRCGTFFDWGKTAHIRMIPEIVWE